MFTKANNILISGGQFINGLQEEQSAIKLIVGAFQDHYVSRATHDNNEILDPPKCRPGTFVPLLDRLSSWIKDESSPVYICWLHGPADVGKSAISRSLAEILDSESLLAGTFFFSRTDPSRNSEKPLVATLAQQLAFAMPETQAYIAESLSRDPTILSRSLKTQFEKLIVNPIVQITSTSTQSPPIRPTLMVIDGLDECEVPVARCLILNTLCMASPKLHGRLRFLIASRPEDDIHNFFHTKAATIGEHINFIDVLVDMHGDLNQELPSQAPLTVPVANDTSRPPSRAQPISAEEKSPSPIRTVPVASTSISLSQTQPISLEDLFPEAVTIAPVVGSTESEKSSFVEKKATGIIGITKDDLETPTKDISVIRPKLIETDMNKVIVDAFQGHYVSSATHDHKEIFDPSKCQPGAFVSLLDRLSSWLKDERGPVDITWLHGHAGVGKSIIARALAETLEAEGLLAGTFFFCQSDPNRNSEKRLVVTLAQQLAFAIPETQACIADSLIRDPAIFSGPLKSQFETLIVNPIVQLTSASMQPLTRTRPLLVIIDGLDECKDPAARSLIATTICAAFPQMHGWLRFLMASRPEQDIFQTTANTMGEHINFIEVTMDVHFQTNITTPTVNSTSRSPSQVQQISVGDRSPGTGKTTPIANNTSVNQVQQISVERKLPSQTAETVPVVHNTFGSRSHVTDLILSPQDAITTVMSSINTGKSTLLEMVTGIRGMVGQTRRSSDETPKIIVFVGPSGSGKSQFVRYLVPEHQKGSVPVNSKIIPTPHGILSFKMANRNGHSDSVILVDTPGFDDAGLGPSGVLKEVIKWMKQNHSNAKVTGILCLHRITDNRLTSTSRPPTSILKDLCGKTANAARQVALVTTHWDTPKPRNEKIENEKRLEQGVWALLSRMGARTERFNNTPERAREIIERLLSLVLHPP